MPPTRIYHNYTKVPIISTLALLFCNYELYRITTGTHPYIRLKINGRPINSSSETEQTQTVERKSADRVGKHVAPFEDKMPVEPGPAWTSLNGIPIPTFEMLMRPWRRD